MKIKKIVDGVEVEVEETAEEITAREASDAKVKADADAAKAKAEADAGGKKDDDDDDDDDDEGKEMITLSKKKFNKREQKIQELQAELERNNSATPKDIKELATKYNLQEAFVKDMVSLGEANAEAKIRGTISPLLERQEQEKRNEGFNKAFEEEIVMHPALSEKKEQIKKLSFLKENADKSITEIAQEFYPETVGRKTSESDADRFSEKDLEQIDFQKMSDAQRAIVLKNPKAREKYYAWADKNGL